MVTLPSIGQQQPVQPSRGSVTVLQINIIKAELRKQILNGLIYTHVNSCPSPTHLRLHSPCCGTSTSIRCPQSNHFSDRGSWVACYAASCMNLLFLLFFLKYPNWSVVSGLHPLCVGYFSSSVKCCFSCPVKAHTLKKSSLRSSALNVTLFISILI